MPAHPESRLSLRAITVGTVVTVSIFLTLLSLLAALSIWSFELNEMPFATNRFWVSVFSAWTISVLLGSMFASAALIPRTGMNGALNAIATWALSYLFVTSVLVLATGETFNFARGDLADDGPFWTVFIGSALSFVASVTAGRYSGWTIRIEDSTPSREKQRPASTSTAHPSAHAHPH